MSDEPETDVIPQICIDANNFQVFVRDASPASWLEYGEELRNSAELLWSHSEEGKRVDATLNANSELQGRGSVISTVSRTYMLLSGFALENVIKGTLVALDPSRVNQGKLSKDLISHKLGILADKIPGLVLSLEEREFLNNATDAIPCWGRYPIPLEKGALSVEVAVDNQIRTTFLGLFERLAHHLYWMVRDGWDSGVGPKTLKMRSSSYGDKIDPAETLF